MKQDEEGHEQSQDAIRPGFATKNGRQAGKSS